MGNYLRTMKWEKLSEHEKAGKTLVLWRRVMGDKEEFTTSHKTHVYYRQPPLRKGGGYYTRDSLKTILGIDLTKEESVT